MSKVSKAPISRRRLMIAGAGAAGAAAAVAALPIAKQAPVTAAKHDVPEQGGGYQVTEHVLTYYKTARV